MKKGFKLSPLISRSFSSYTNRSTGPPPPPRRRSTAPTQSPPSSSRLSGFIDGENDRSSIETRTRGKPNFNTNNNKGYNPKNSFNDDHEHSHKSLSPNRATNLDGFLDRFKLGLDQETEQKDTRVVEGDVEGEGEMPPPEDADEIFRKMKETGLIPNAVAMLHGLCSDGLVHDAMKLFGEMRERGSIPEVVIYTAVVEGFCKSWKLDEAIRIFRKMQKNGIVPNAFSYGVIVNGLVKGKKLDDGLGFCLEMVEAGHSPNLGTFMGLVSVFCKERGLESARVVIGSLKDKGFGFDEKAVRDFMEKKGPFSPSVWEAILGKKGSQMF